MFSDQVVPIPKVPGKIVFRKINGSVYVEYEIRRIYDPGKKHNIPERARIGVQIPGKPEMMLPNEKYITYFPKEEEKMPEQEKAAAQQYADEREYGLILRDFFDQLFFEFQMQSRKKPNSVVNEYKVERLNRVLKPLRKMMQGETYAAFLEEIPAPEIKEDTDRKQQG